MEFFSGDGQPRAWSQCYRVARQRRLFGGLCSGPGRVEKRFMGKVIRDGVLSQKMPQREHIWTAQRDSLSSPTTVQENAAKKRVASRAASVRSITFTELQRDRTPESFNVLKAPRASSGNVKIIELNLFTPARCRWCPCCLVLRCLRILDEVTVWPSQHTPCWCWHASTWRSENCDTGWCNPHVVCC